MSRLTEAREHYQCGLNELEDAVSIGSGTARVMSAHAETALAYFAAGDLALKLAAAEDPVPARTMGSAELHTES